MKAYFYREPSLKLVRACYWLRNKCKFTKWPLAVILVAIWATVIPPCWLVIKLSNFCHNVVGWCGFNSREW